MAVVLSCEHGGNEVPARYAGLFASGAAWSALGSHRGWDPGSAEIGRVMARALDAPIVVQRVTRLLVDCNRSLGHPRLFSELSRVLSEAERNELIAEHWKPHRERVRDLVDRAPPDATVVHVGVHTFTPVWEGRERATDVGLLYDPRRKGEAELVRRWRAEMLRSWSADERADDERAHDERADDEWTGSERAHGAVRIHLNRPYRGWTDGLTSTLRSELPESRYLGVELEVSQRLLPLGIGRVERMAVALQSALRASRHVDSRSPRST